MTPLISNHRLGLSLLLASCVCAMAQSPPGRSTRYEAENMDAAYGDNQRASSPDASNGAYTWCEQGRNKPSFFFANGYDDIPQGLYRVTWRLKVKSNTGARPVVRLDCTEPGGRRYTLQTVDLKPTDFKAAGTWQDFTYEFERTEMGRIQYRGYFLGDGDVALDKLDIEFVRPFTDEELYERESKLYPVKVPADLDAVWKNTRHDGFRVLELKGAPFEDLWRLPEAVAKIPAAKLDSRPWTKVWSLDFKATDKYLPWTYEELFAFDVVVLTCGDVRRLQAVGRKMLADYVAAGGRLIVLGGYASYGKGSVKGTWAEKLFGVTIDSPWDLVPVKHADLTRPGKWPELPDGWFSSLTDRNARFPWPVGGKTPQAEWLHAVTPGPDTTVLWKCGGKPALLERHVGNGVVRLITLSQLGARDNQQKLFCDLAGWPVVFAKILHD